MQKPILNKYLITIETLTNFKKYNITAYTQSAAISKALLQHGKLNADDKISIKIQ